MSQQHDRKSEDEGFQDIYLEDILEGVGAVLAMASEFIGALGASDASHIDPASDSRSGTRPPLVDIFDEGCEIVLAIELAGASPDHVAVEVQDDILSLEIGGAHSYKTEMLLPRVVAPASIRRTFRNGILEIRLK